MLLYKNKAAKMVWIFVQYLKYLYLLLHYIEHFISATIYTSFNLVWIVKIVITHTNKVEYYRNLLFNDCVFYSVRVFT